MDGGERRAVMNDARHDLSQKNRPVEGAFLEPNIAKPEGGIKGRVANSKVGQIKLFFSFLRLLRLLFSTLSPQQKVGSTSNIGSCHPQNQTTLRCWLRLAHKSIPRRQLLGDCSVASSLRAQIAMVAV